jgi:sialate O-acetylesterase
MLKRALIFLLAVFCFTLACRADVHVPHIFGSHMVLQQGKPIIIWGWADPDENVAIDLGATGAINDRETASTRADGSGKWSVSLPPMTAGGSPLTLNITGKNKISFDDILVGEVWICSGQSNMEFGIGNSINGAQEIADANDPQIRLMKVEKAWKPQPQRDIAGEWKLCTPTSVAAGGWNGFSAVGYFFGRELHRTLNVPVGLIDASWGGTRIESWTPPQGFAAVPALKSENELLQRQLTDSPEHTRLLADAITQMSAWTKTAQDSLTNKTQCPPLPQVPKELFGPDNVQAATALFNGMIHPLCPLGIRGAIWYQGESNHDEGTLYTERMKALVGGWRTIWNQGGFPFYFVQIAPFNYGGNPTVLPEFWEAQAQAERQIPNTGMIVVNDIGNLADIHPKNNQDVGHRLAVRALNQTYGKADVLGQSPTLKSLKTDGDQLIISFDHAGAGLSTRDNQPPTWFEIAGENSGGFKPATAVINGDTVVLTSPQVKSPTAVRFAWSMLAEPNLQNSAHLPASAFRAGAVSMRDHISENVPEIKQYQLVYDLDLSQLGHDIHYTADHSAEITKPFDRIAYAMELQDTTGKVQWVYTSMDAFTKQPDKIGVPTVASGEQFQCNVSNLIVFSNVPGIVTGENLPGGNIEFWPNNYGTANATRVPNASDATYDFGDQISSDLTDGYGSMQVHNHDAKQTLFALNHWKETPADIGIGNAPSGNPDWTFAKNADTYFTKRLRVFVRVK